jgi:sugar phosphate permease
MSLSTPTEKPEGNSSQLAHASSQESSERMVGSPKTELKEEDVPEKLGFAFSTYKKWRILAIIFLVQVSMNFNASVYGNAIARLTERYGITEQYARVGQLGFLVAYAFGCELWAPWSEELGRKPILQWSLGLVNLWQIPCALAPK